MYSAGKASITEEQELFNWMANGNDEPVKRHIEELVSSYNSNEIVPKVDWEHLYQKILDEKGSLGVEPVGRKMVWRRWAAAAAAILLIGTGYYFLTATHKVQMPVSTIEQPKMNDIAAPNTVNAVITLSNGQKVILDSMGNGMLAVQGTVQIVKLPNGQIVYSGTNKEIQYNTLSNPRGSKAVNIILADGSKVWLNAASSLRYPTAFTGNERNIDITGEAYFEVARHVGMPFIVHKGSTSIKVLGTHFNVNTFDDEKSLKVTLLEGSVNVRNENTKESEVIKPGEQASVSKNGKIELANSVDLTEVTAWKNGLFLFKGDDIEFIMREVSRWYDVKVVFQKQISEKFYAEVTRNTSLSSLLKMLETTKAVKFEIEGNTIIVRS